MVQLRTSRRRMIITSSDNEDDREPRQDDLHGGKPKVTPLVRDRSRSTAKKLPSKATSSQGATIQNSPQKSAANSDRAIPKPKTKPIYSFFNAATQKLQTSQPLGISDISCPSDEGVEAISEDIEAIHDDSDGQHTPLESSSGVASKEASSILTLRKRKFRHTDSFESEAAAVAPASQKFRKASSGDRVAPLSVYNDDKRPWTEQFAPTDLSELAVHKKKVADVRQWLQSSLEGRRRKVLVLKGAAGVGKTTTVTLLAQSLGVDLLEWKDASTSDYSAELQSSSISRFEEFVGRAGKSRGLVLVSDPQDLSSPSNDVTNDDETASAANNQRPQALLIEEFPNTFSRTSTPLSAFRSSVAQYLATPVSAGVATVPLIMVISETLLSTNTAAADSFTAHRLLGPELMMHPYLNVIEFNPVAPTFLVKALETIVVKEARKSGRRKTPGPQVLKRLAETGDIRSAISSLEFLCLQGDDSDTWSSKVAFTKPRQRKHEPALTKSEEEALKLISNRESTLGIFHSVGKIVYNKRIPPATGSELAQPPPWLPQYSRQGLPDTNVDTLFEDLGTDIPTFVAALHENYALSCTGSGSDQTLDGIFGCIQTISDADLLSLDCLSFRARTSTGSAADGFRQDEICFQVAARGTLFNLPSPVHRVPPNGGKPGDAHRMFYPKSLQLWKKKEEIEGKLDLLVAGLKRGTEAARFCRSTRREQVGVEKWNSGNSLDASETVPNHDNSASTSEVKAEMLLTRLPFLAQILSASAASPFSSDLQQKVAEITDLWSIASASNGDDAFDKEDEENIGDAEHWATDLHENETEGKRKQANKAAGSKPRAAFEGGGLAIPVESRVEKLVLEDDDIVDD